MTDDGKAWVIIRTEIRKEYHVYNWIVTVLNCDAWLPETPTFSRLHRSTKSRRETWQASLPTLFFAKIDLLDLIRLEGHPMFVRMERRWSGEAIVLDEAELDIFRAGVEREKQQMFRMGKRAADDLLPKLSRAKTGKVSRRIKRGSPKQPAAAKRLEEWADRLIKAEQTPPCVIPAKLISSPPDRVRPDPQAAHSAEPRGLRPEPVTGAD